MTDRASSPTLNKAYAPYDPRRASVRLVLAVLVGAVTGLALPHEMTRGVRFVAAWDAGSFALLTLALNIVFRSDAAETQRRAASVDPGRTVVWALVSLASAFSLFAATVVLRQARSACPGGPGLAVGLCLGAVIGAWALTHTSYTLRYAHLYYREDDEGVGGIEFSGNAAPDYFDFAYVAFTVGMCFQVSDVAITSRAIRRTALGHAILSFAYNTAILALSLNLLSGLLG